MREDENGIYQQYRVLRRPGGGLWELGRGGMAVVYKAVDTGRDTFVALKVISPLFIDNDRARERFIREAKAEAGLRHRNVARVFHSALDVRDCFVAMELLEGETVDRLVARAGPQPWPAALSLALQVNAGLAAAHEAGLIHRDLKPANIQLVHEPESEAAIVKLSDFALAEPGTGAGPVPGTGFLVAALYASPEQCRGVAPDIRSNIYSLALTFWHLLAGAPPFNASSGNLFRQHQHSPPPFKRLPRQLPAPLRALLGRMLAKEPGGRPQTPMELAAEMESFLPAGGAAQPAASVVPRSLAKLPAALPFAEILVEPAPVTAPPAESCAADAAAAETLLDQAEFDLPLPGPIVPMTDPPAPGAVILLEPEAAVPLADPLKAHPELALETASIAVEQSHTEVPPAEPIVLLVEPAPLAELAVPEPETAVPLAHSLVELREPAPETAPAVVERPHIEVPSADPIPGEFIPEIPRTGLRLRDCMHKLGGKLPAAVVANLLDPLAEILDGAPGAPLKLTPEGICLSLDGEAIDTPHFGASFTDPWLTRGRPAWIEIEAPLQEGSDVVRDKIPPGAPALNGVAALAGLVYELLGGAPPVPSQPYLPLAECNVQGNATLRRALENGFRSASDATRFASRLAPALRAAPAPVIPRARSTRLPLEKRKSGSYKIAAALVAILGLAAGAGVWLWTTSSPETAAAVRTPAGAAALDSPGTAARVEALLGQARSQMEAGRWPEAARSYAQVLALRPDSLEALSAGGTAYRFAGDAGLARKNFNRAIRLQPADALEHLYRADAYACLNQPGKAKPDYQAAAAMDVGAARDFWLRGHAYLSLQKNDLALMDFAEAIRLDPQNAVALVDRGNALLNLQKDDAALADFDQAVHLNPTLAEAWTGRGYAHSRRKEFALALQDFDQSIRLTPRDSLAWNGRGVCHFSLQQMDLAVDALNQAFRLNPRDPTILFNRGSAFAAQRKFDLAIADFTGAIQLDPRFVFAFRSRGAAYDHLKQYDLALNDFDEAIRLQPENADNYLLRGNGYNSAEKYDLAIVDFDEAIRRNPKLAAAFAGRGYANECLEDYQGALEDYAQVIQLNSNDAAAFDDRGRVYAALHKYERAIQDFDEAIRLAPNFRDAYDQRAAANHALGRTAAAKRDEAFIKQQAKP